MFPWQELKGGHLASYTPEWAERESGIPAEAIKRIALEFAAAAPAATTMCNRGSSAHLNGFYNALKFKLSWKCKKSWLVLESLECEDQFAKTPAQETCLG